jgi:hypothetical protein
MDASPEQIIISAEGCHEIKIHLDTL